MSEAMQGALAAAINDWLQSHPAMMRILQLVMWASNHPFLSVIILLFGVAIASSLITAIGHLMEMLWLSLLQAPLKLARLLLGASTKSLGRFGILTVKQAREAQNSQPLILPPATAQARLGEILSRLEAIQKEQNQLLQEITTILGAEKRI